MKTLLGREAVITRDIHKFSNSSLQKINYSSTKFDAESLWIMPFGLLEETEIKQQNIECSDWNGLKIFFSTKGTLPFDLLSAAFYLLSRYEEYFDDSKTDAYGNYHHTNSTAYKNNFLQLPLINLWLQEIEKEFNLIINKSPFTVTPTYDIDIAFAYKHHSFVRTFGGIAKNIFRFNRNFIDRLRIIFGKEKDPFDIFDWLDKLHRKYRLKAKYFFLLAKKRGLYDKNSSPKNNTFKKLIKQHSANYAIGIHPSFASNKNKNTLQLEIKTLEKITQKPVKISRQHYLQLNFPNTYLNLISAGIKEDYTMGYGTQNGFRASYSLPFYWYNLSEEMETNLLLHPFCYMDANCIFEQKLTPQQALEEMLFYYNTVKNVNGNFMYIMHNHFLANQPEWKSWVTVYNDFLTQIND
ncbi:MAG: polysaccharide deacetylase family protein [Chitinophagaceae bacterium]